MKRFLNLTLVALVSLAAWGLLSLLPSKGSNAFHAQSPYPPPLSDPLLDPYPPPPTAYPGPEDTQATPSLIPTSEPELTSISITISVEGLQEGDEAQASLLPFTESTKAQVESNEAVLPSITLSNGVHMIQAENIPTGIYKLIIQTSSEYFRNPKGYIIRVSEAGVVLSPNQTLQFNVMPTNIKGLPPCRNIVINDELHRTVTDLEDIPYADQDICMAEGIVDISGPILIRQLRVNPNSPDYGNYYYAGPRTTQDNQGVWGQNYVVDPVLNQSVGYDQFVAERVYADNGSNWMEAGWTEKSWLDDRQYTVN